MSNAAAVVVRTRKGAQGIEQIIFRACGQCGDPNTPDPITQLRPDNCVRCKWPLAKPDNRGLVSFYHPNPLVRAWYRMLLAFGRRLRWRLRDSSKS